MRANLLLILSIMSLVICTIAIIWQIVQWRRSGSVVRVELLAGVVCHGRVVSGSLKSFDEQHCQRLIADGFDQLLFIARARNVGRIAVDVTHWSIGFRK